MTEVSPLLRVLGLRAGYSGVEVLKGVDLEVAPGEFSVVIGPNGHGKTTLMRTISGLNRPTAGTIDFDGTSLLGATPESIVRRGVVHIPQGDLLFADMSVAENLALGAFTAGAHKNRARNLERVYDLFPRLKERHAQRARTLSGGERRMVAIGRGLMANARMLIIDEPSLGLAPVLVDEVYKTIREIHRSGLTVVLVEENVSRVRGIADHVTCDRYPTKSADIDHWTFNDFPSVFIPKQAPNMEASKQFAAFLFGAFSASGSSRSSCFTRSLRAIWKKGQSVLYSTMTGFSS